MDKGAQVQDPSIIAGLKPRHQLSRSQCTLPIACCPRKQSGGTASRQSPLRRTTKAPAMPEPTSSNGEFELYVHKCYPP